VDECATAGDAIAEDLLNVAAQQLSAITSACRRQLFKDEQKVFVAHVGGVFKSERLRERFRFLVEFYGNTTLGEPKMNPAAGALLEAYRLVHKVVTLSNVPDLK
jgi:N-acetylglucosamine kinase-like BadF-type ATPase